MDVHPSRELVASGQRAGTDRKSQAHVRIWSTESLQTLYVFGMGELNVGVSAVAFSQLVTIAWIFMFSQHFRILNNDHINNILLYSYDRMVVAIYWRLMQVQRVFCLCGNGNGDIY